MFEQPNVPSRLSPLLPPVVFAIDSTLLWTWSVTDEESVDDKLRRASKRASSITMMVCGLTSEMEH